MTESSTIQPDDPFAEIRPFSNTEAPDVFRRLVHDEELIETIARWRFPIPYRVLRSAARFMARIWLRVAARKLSTVEDLQNLIAPNLARMINKTSRFSVSGVNALDLDQPRVYLSNHRDIAMDPAYANYALHSTGAKTLAVAIGDNLLSKPWVADLMRLNKSFVVKRNVNGPRALLAATKLLAGYIRQAVSEDGQSVWIAHREGRAKDGRDLTEPAVIKMLTLSRRREDSLESVLSELGIVPLIISYELDPCDVLKAAELLAGDAYVKTEFEDVASIATGITGEKGCVHLHFGEPIAPDLDVASVVAAIDEQMVRHYRLYPTNVWAWEQLSGKVLPDKLDVQPGSISRQCFEARFNAVPERHRQQLLTMYANPVTRVLALSGQNQGTPID